MTKETEAEKAEERDDRHDGQTQPEADQSKKPVEPGKQCPDQPAPERDPPRRLQLVRRNSGRRIGGYREVVSWRTGGRKNVVIR